MARKKRTERKKHPGASPGTLVHVGEKKAERIRVTMIDYNDQTLEERQVEEVTELAAWKQVPTVTWINVDGLHDTALIEKMGQVFDLHALVLEDILNTQQRPKLESHDGYIFVVLKMLSSVQNSAEIHSEQVSLILGPGYVLSFQEEAGDVFAPVRQRIRSRKGRICGMGPDYLFYALVDAVVDHYFVVLEKVAERLEVLEDAVFEDPTMSTLAEIQRLKVELLRFRKAIWPLRETINGLLREESELITEKTEIFLKDVYDHTIQVIDTVEGFRDTVSGLLDVYLSSISNRMNEVMKVLTIIATIFIPLTFVAGIYGMNFEYMPELKLFWAYPLVLLVMLIVGSGMIVYFRRKGWF
ncbi:MAG TPA: magnesium/cobalt transporter CorA [Acidobacteriota bacterium]|nr:magnesium/cobalt transporter CorA [Acidobacteriota bacterium]